MSNNNVTVSMVGLGEIAPSPTNPRQHFDAAQLDELAASIRAAGVLSPLTVRPINTCLSGKYQGAKYEIIAGERRWLAAQLAGLDALPVMVRELDDQRVLELQMIENLQRDDLSPLDEARGYEQMLALTKDGAPVYTVAALAASIGKSEQYVVKRRQLARLKGPALAALEQGVISVSHCLLLCRIQRADTLAEVVKKVLEPHDWRRAKGEPLTVRETEELINGEYARSLKGAPFDPRAAALVPDAGACANCAKCSSSNSEFFGAVPEMCYDLPCFQRKADAAWALRVAAERAADPMVEVIADEKFSEKFRNGKLGYGANEKYIDLDAKPEEYELADGVKPAKWKKLLKKPEALPRLLVRDDRGTAHLLMERNNALLLLNEQGLTVLREQKQKRGGGGTDDAYKKEQRQLRELGRAQEDATVRVLEQVFAKIAGAGVEPTDILLKAPAGLWPAMLGCAVDVAHDDGAVLLCRMFGVEKEPGGRTNWSLKLLKHCEKMPPIQLLALTLLAMVARWAKYQYGAKDIKALASAYDIDMARALKEVQAERVGAKKTAPTPPLPPNVTPKILLAWQEKYYPALPPKTWDEISRDKQLRDKFLAWCEATAKQGRQRRREAPRKKESGGNHTPPQAPSKESGGNHTPPKTPNKKSKAAATLGADGAADEAVRWQIPLGEIAAVADNDGRLSQLAAYAELSVSNISNHLCISRAAAAAWLKRLAVKNNQSSIINKK
ncbi:MAG: ParB/RepB/Spo0J family partition protein [Verrucomicrobiales bacterium]|jgi:ParB/RepB/Spo0J family partition protein|nr:ParB/RepB/Spo0J family partition protein [Verrucomicrobiales bacterium]